MLPVHLVAREDELAEIARLLASVRDGLSAIIVLRGEAGIGKTALLDAAMASADDLVVVRVVGIESEIELGFSALHQVLNRFANGIDALPRPQAGALGAAFGLTDDSAPDLFLVGLAALTLLSNAAARRGLLIIIDDAQWLDRESATVLGFVARRLFAERIGLLVAFREPSELQLAFDGLPSVTVGALQKQASLELLALCVVAPIASHVRERILADAGGNPLALLELSQELSQDQLAGTELLPEPLAVGRQLEARFLRRVRGLPPETQTLLLVLAAEPTGDHILVRSAARQLGVGDDANVPAEAANLLSLGPPIDFRHSLIRSAVYHGATGADRRRAHEALAAAIDVDRDPDRRAWHRAAATGVPDEDVANELERAANRAQNHGGYAASAALLARAAQLTPEPSRRALRFLGAARADITAGSSVRAHANLALARPGLRDAALVAQSRRLEATILFVDVSLGSRGSSSGLGRHEEIVSIMVNAALALGPLDMRVARETVLDAFPMAIYFETLTSTSIADVGRAAKSLKLPSDIAPSSLDLVLDALAELFAEGFGSAVPLLRRGVAAVRADPEVPGFSRRMRLGCWAALALSDDDAVRALAGESAAVSRDRGELQVLAEALNYLGWSEVRVGSLSAADVYFTESNGIEAFLRRSGLAEANKLIVSAWRGREAVVRAAAPILEKGARDLGLGLVVALTESAVMLLELGLGNYHAASERPTGELGGDVALGAFRAADVIEAHARGGDRDVAYSALAWLSERALANESPLDLGLLARSRALLGADSEAEAHFREAVVRLGASGGSLHLARAQLLYGEWLRRQNRRVDARSQLTAAVDVFESMGIKGFAERARIELLATGARARRRIDETRHDLTPQEEQIARLAADGATNPEIAARLFISANTVEYHLRKVYRKLDIKSRRDLIRTAFAATDSKPSWIERSVTPHKIAGPST
jgi:DNA-binding CsgD family transcriptional regulator